MSDKQVLDYAKSRGYDGAKKETVKYKGFDVYTPTLNGNGVAFVGFPLVILAKDNEIRMSTEDESLDVLAMINPKNNDSEYFE